MHEAIAGTRAAGERLGNAELEFCATLQERAPGLTEDEARHVFDVFRTLRAVKRAGLNRYVVTHGAYLDADVIRRAARMQR